MRAGVITIFFVIAFHLPAQTPSLASLQARLSNHLAQTKFSAAAWGVKIASLDSGETLFDHDSHKLLKPASNAKLYTGALALDRLGPDFRIRTSLLARARPERSGTLRGDLIVFGRGDPSFSVRFDAVSITNLLAPLADALAAAGVRRIKGDLIGDESYFRGPPFGAEWTWGDLQYYYGAEASSLTVQDNTVDLVLRPGRDLGAPCLIETLPPTTYLTFDNRTRTVPTGGRTRLDLYRPVAQNVVHFTGTIARHGTNVTDAVSVHRPALWFVTLLKETLARRGIKVSGGVRAVDWLERERNGTKRLLSRPSGTLSSAWSGGEGRGEEAFVEIASVESRPLSEILAKMMKPSQNLYAHLLLLQVGARGGSTTNSNITTEDLGLAELRRFLHDAGIPRDEVLLEEGSGLSRGALVTPRATVALLRHMHRHRHAQVFRAALPLAGVDGTLRRRMKETAAFENVRAKTGTLRYVNTLSGYVTTRAGQSLVFSLMLNNYDGNDARAALDTIAVMLAEAEMVLAP